eukprot:CAMPEP_0169485738 /NCGR_PEP_ID=MMETSP1042-20121227/32451_1 /TAXON_ID=464988 /ORGANISM="Hemiselmis andersenii, Strain CCMP1180" /LENGTH=93 /DNA_ID=CAMNT_0009600857 /DNA_START=315 /DNA_END=592 /DNA_ORIENTATION=+
MALQAVVQVMVSSIPATGAPASSTVTVALHAAQFHPPNAQSNSAGSVGGAAAATSESPPHASRQLNSDDPTVKFAPETVKRVAPKGAPLGRRH